MPYYVVKDGQRVGPLSDEEFQNRILSGEIGPDTLVWQAGMADWKRYAEHSGLEAPPPPLSPPEASPQPTFLTGPTGVCAECGNTFVRDELVSIAGSSVCAGCKPLFLQRIREGASLPSAYRYAGFWIRFAAKFIDGLILNVMSVAVQTGILGISVSMSVQQGQGSLRQALASTGVGLVISLIYIVYFLGKFGATPGKMAVGIKVIRSDGAPITYGRAAGRFFAEFLSQFTILIGYIMAGFDEQKRALHDHICDTRVVKK